MDTRTNITTTDATTAWNGIKYLMSQREIDVNCGYLPSNEVVTLNGDRVNPNIIPGFASIKNDTFRTALMCASRQGRVNEVKFLLSKYKDSIDINTKDETGKTAFMHAACGNHVDTMKLLLNTGKIDIQAKTNDNRTVLSLATSYGSVNAIKLLVSSNDDDDCEIECKIDQLQLQIDAAFIDATSNNCKNTNGIQYLLQHQSVNINAIDEEGFTALMHSIFAESDELVKLLLSYDEIDVNIRTHNVNAISVCILTGNINMLELLLATGKVPMHEIEKAFILSPQTLDALKYLIDNRMVNINATCDLDDVKGVTALIHAVIADHDEKVKFLLSEPYVNQIDINAETSARLNAFGYATQKADSDMLQRLMATGKITQTQIMDSVQYLQNMTERIKQDGDSKSETNL